MSGRRRRHEEQTPLRNLLLGSGEEEWMAGQELVRLEHPRPPILRSANDYVLVPSTSTAAAPPPRRRTSAQKKGGSGAFSDFDRAKVHAAKPRQHPPEDSHLVTLDFGQARSREVRRQFRDGSVLLPQRTSSVRNPSSLISQQPGRLQSHSAPPTLWSATTSGGEGSSSRCWRCGRCRCSACRTPRVLPTHWFCDNACLCSAEAVVDTASCMCCVRGCLYHCEQSRRDWSGAEAEAEAAVDLSDAALVDCSGGGGECCVRWGCLLGAMACLPCLWCYLPLKGLASLANVCYARYHFRGCRCAPPPHLNPRLQSKLRHGAATS